MTKEQLLKIGKTALYVGLSAAIGVLIAWVEGSPELFGIYAPIINIVLVTIRQVFKTEE